MFASKASPVSRRCRRRLPPPSLVAAETPQRVRRVAAEMRAQRDAGVAALPTTLLLADEDRWRRHAAHLPPGEPEPSASARLLPPAHARGLTGGEGGAGEGAIPDVLPGEAESLRECAEGGRGAEGGCS